MFLTSAFVLGLIGSFHCVGMCGPIAVALPINNQSWSSRLIGTLLYNLGRAITYAILGAIFGVLGEGIQLGGFQSWVSIIMGIMMILSVFFPILFRNTAFMNQFIYGYVSKLKSQLGPLLHSRSLGSLFIIGLLNGLLPCGLVYVALALAIATGSVSSGAMFMFVFGIGTAPLLAVLTLLGNVVSSSFKSKINKIIPLVIVLIGVLFVLRGMNLGIPYISPPAKKLILPTDADSTGSRGCCGSAKDMDTKTLQLYPETK